MVQVQRLLQIPFPFQDMDLETWLSISERFAAGSEIQLQNGTKIKISILTPPP